MNRAVKIRIYPNKEQRVQIEQTIGCSRFIYNQMLADKISYYQKEKKMLRNTPAGYKKEYPWLKEVDSLALANAQLHLESAFRKFFREPACGFPRYKSKKHARNSYTTNALNGNILLQDTHLKLPKMSVIRIKLHRQIPSDWKLKSVTVSREPSGKYFASLLFCCENQTVEKRPAERFLGIDFAMQGMCVFSTGERGGYPMFYRKAEKKLAREQRNLSHCEKGSQKDCYSALEHIKYGDCNRPLFAKHPPRVRCTYIAGSEITDILTFQYFHSKVTGRTRARKISEYKPKK